MRAAKTDRLWPQWILPPAMWVSDPCRPRWLRAVARQRQVWSRSACLGAPGLPKRGSSTTHRPHCLALTHRSFLLTTIPRRIMLPFLSGMEPLEKKGRLFLRTRQDRLMAEAWVSVDAVD